LIDAAKEIGGLAYTAVFLDAFTGLRRGELLALQYRDVDWLNKEICVQRAVSKVPADDGVHKWLWKIGPTKNKKARRVAAVDAVIQLLAGLKSGRPEEAFILAGPAGDFIDPDYFDASIFAPVAERPKLKFRFHDLRHFFASMLIDQGESAKYVCDQLGHSSIQVTFDTYGHLFPQAKQEAAQRLQKSMFAGRQEEPTGSAIGSKTQQSAEQSHPERRLN
jgi:integrase